MIAKPFKFEIECRIDGSGPDDLFVTSAEYVEFPDLAVPDATIRFIERHYAEEIYFEYIEQQIGYAEAAAEGMER